MAKRRFKSLKVRTALTLVLMTAVVLVASSLVLIVRAWQDERRDIDSQAEAYAALTTGPICTHYDTYFASGTRKFLELVRDLRLLSPDVERLRIIDVEGRVLFDSALAETAAGGTGERIEDPRRLAAVRGLEPVFFATDSTFGERFEIVSPFVEDWGAHRLSVLYSFSYRNLRPRVLRQLAASGGLTGLAVIVALLVGVALTARIVRPLERLTEGARALAKGRFDERLDIRSGDEVQVLAEAFNQMAEELESSLGRLAESNRALAAERHELEAKNAELERFAYTVSHDLKSPLVTIRGFLGMLVQDIDRGDAERVESDMAHIQAATGTMARLLDDVLELSRIGRVVNPPEVADFGELVSDGLARVAGAIAERGVEVEVAPGLPPVHGDRPRLAEVLQNLIENAVKFMGEQPRPRIEIGSREADGEGDAGKPVFYVRDNGVGVDPRYHETIFGLFNRLDLSIDGTGIGLALVRRIVVLHGGRIWVESAGKGQGSTFCFTLARAGAGGEEPAS